MANISARHAIIEQPLPVEDPRKRYQQGPVVLAGTGVSLGRTTTLLVPRLRIFSGMRADSLIIALLGHTHP
ncbi:hypothetical protein [Ralstonia solanacearum]|uniref:hypothetical protein n=1 Tax=Ralstonia solanacearum TaxID=305 RepID=UPI0018C2EB33|nr:hypothetical protein [Ralstonia solanacearum]